MARRAKSVASRGSVNNIILDCLLAGDKYGYEIIKEVEEKTNGKTKLKQPSLYSSLKRFEDKGYITSYWGDSDIGGRRHYYSITPLGRANHKGNKNETEEKENTLQPIQSEYIAEDFEELDEQDQAYELDEEVDEDVSLAKKYNTFNVDDKINSLLLDSAEEKEEFVFDETTEPILSEDNYNEFDVGSNYEQDDEQELLEEITEAVKVEEDYIEPERPAENIDNDMIYDHHFYKPAPLAQTPSAEEVDDEESIELTYENTDNNKGRIITDAFGITKIVYEEDMRAKPKKQKVFDNVVLRANVPTPVYDQPRKQVAPVSHFENSTDEEREERNQRFIERFDNITQEKSSNSTSVNKDYKNKLNSLMREEESPEPEQHYVAVEEVEETFEEKEYFAKPEIKTANNELINNNSYNVKMYNQEKQTKSINNSYLLVNKAKFMFGIIMLVVMILQITACMVIIKQHDLLFSSHFWVYQVSYAIVAVVTLYYCIPVFISPNKQATSKFKLNYSLMFGVLAFLISLLLIYSINTFMGFEYSNVNAFLTPLIVPSVLVSNFVIGPIIYKLITLNKKFY